MAVPYTFGTATASIPLSNLDSNFATTITLGNTAIQLGNTVTTLNNMTLANVTVSSGSVTLTNIAVTTANVTTANITTAVIGTATITTAGITTANVATANISGTTTLTGLTASTALALDASKNIVSVTNTGSGNNVLGTSPTIATPTINTITSAASTALVLQSNNGNTAVTFDTSQNATFVGYASLPNTFGFKNRIINGAMGIWQRGTSFTGITNSPTYTADRWGGFVTAAVAGEQVLQSSSTPSGQGFKYSAAFGRTAANTNTNSIWFVQLIESVNMLDLASQSVTLSFWAKSGANYSGGNLSILVNSGTSADQSLATFSGGPCTGYTGNASVINGSQALTTTWTKYTFTGSVGSTAQEIGIAFGYTPTGTAGADDNIYITGVQLEKGSTATSFDYRPYGTELALCQRYFVKTNTSNTQRCGGLWGTTYTSTAGHLTGLLPVSMRTAPTVTAGGTSNTFFMSNINATSAGTFGTFSTSELTIDAEVSSMTVSVTGQPIQYNGQLSIAAEL